MHHRCEGTVEGMFEGVKQLATLRLRELRLTARGECDITRDINRLAVARQSLYRHLAELGRDEATSDEVKSIGWRLDDLYEELRISRMVAA